MAKKKVAFATTEPVHDHQRGVIQDNHLKALVTSTLFQARVEPSKKGKGSYQRKAKHGKRWEPGQQQRGRVCC
ncbi:alternative ribosome-rescue factor A [Aeromonas media]|uniref:alternative ribosome-rescue factor A n=1 Tax=Aeromonas media TaxID=651 RepID=UPI000FA53CE4